MANEKKRRFYIDEFKVMDGLVIYRRSDVKHQRYSCRIGLKGQRRYKVKALSATSRDVAIKEATGHFYRTQHDLENDRSVFKRTFAQVAAEFLAEQKRRAGLSGKGGITLHHWRVMDSHVRCHLLGYVGNKSVDRIARSEWAGYVSWRQESGKGQGGGAVSTATIRTEMSTFRTIMRFAASKGYARDTTVRDAFNGRLLTANTSRDEFTKTEFQHLKEFMKGWVDESHPGISATNTWTRQMVRYLILLLSETGMRTAEARNLKWGDVHWQGKRVTLNVYGKGKRRTFEAAKAAWACLEGIKEISPATKSSDFVFCRFNGKRTKTLYTRSVKRLLDKAGLSKSSSGGARGLYCFRHSFATWRLQDGADAYQLAKHMGTSVTMIQQHYGHVSESDVADNVLGDRRRQGAPRDLQTAYIEAALHGDGNYVIDEESFERARAAYRQR